MHNNVYFRLYFSGIAVRGCYFNEGLIMKIQERTRAEELFKKFCAGYKARDLPYLLTLFTKNSNMWGSGLDEYRVGLKQIEEQLLRDWSQSDAGEIHILSFVPGNQDSLWSAALCEAKLTIAGKEYSFSHFRGTIVVEKEEDSWKIAHMHASFPDYRNSEGNSFPTQQ